MKPILSALATAVLIAGSMFLGGGAAQATTCPVGYHFNDIGNGTGFCASNPSGGGTGGPMVFDGGGTGSGSYGEPMAPPVKQAPSAPVYQAPPAYNPPPAYRAPAGNAPVRGTAPQIQAPPVQNHAPAPVRAPQAPAAGYAPAYTAPGGTAVQHTQGVGANPATGSVAEAGATPADVPATAAPAIVLPANEAQAVDALRSATATAPEKDAALAIVKTKINAVLDEAIGKALSNR
jgi:hypothetical protein